MPSHLRAGFDVWLPLYVALAFALIVAASGWRRAGRKAIAALPAGMVWSWSVNRVGVIEAAGLAILIAIAAATIRRRRSRGYGDPEANTGFSAK